MTQIRVIGQPVNAIVVGIPGPAGPAGDTGPIGPASNPPFGTNCTNTGPDAFASGTNNTAPGAGAHVFGINGDATGPGSLCHSLGEAEGILRSVSSGNSSYVRGHVSRAEGTHCGVDGPYNVCRGTANFIIGENCSIAVSVANATCMGYASNIYDGANAAAIIGSYDYAYGPYSCLTGTQCASHWYGERCHGGGLSGRIGYRGFDIGSGPASGAQTCTFAGSGPDGNEITVEAGMVQRIRISIMANTANQSKCACEEFSVLVKCASDGTTSIHGSPSTPVIVGASFASYGWSYTLSCPSGRKVRVSVNSGSDVVQTLAWGDLGQNAQ